MDLLTKLNQEGKPLSWLHTNQKLQLCLYVALSFVLSDSKLGPNEIEICNQLDYEP